MVDHIGLRDRNPATVTDGLRRLAHGAVGPAETVAWVSAMLLVRIAKQRAINDTRQVPGKQDPTLFPRVKTFARLQLSDEELAKWM